MAIEPRQIASASMSSNFVETSSIASRLILSAKMNLQKITSTIFEYFIYDEINQNYDGSITYDYFDNNGIMQNNPIPTAMMKGRE